MNRGMATKKMAELHFKESVLLWQKKSGVYVCFSGGASVPAYMSRQKENLCKGAYV